VTFGALNARANRLAHFLRARGVGAETAVGVCLARSIDTVVTLLAILAGGATCRSIATIRRSASASCSRTRPCG
jgi:non-ribosomal peptide synthetase component F